MKIGIFGGCFNPPHKMHKSIAVDLISGGYLDKVIYVPTGDSYNKKDLIALKHRLEMLKLMVAMDDDLLVSNICKDEYLKYTYQQLDYFKNLYGKDDIYFICGSDNLMEFNTWMKYEYILRNYKLLVVVRNNDDIAKILELYQEFADNIEIANVDKGTLSSTKVRKLLKQKENVLEYIEKDVYDYIRKNDLYD